MLNRSLVEGLERGGDEAVMKSSEKRRGLEVT